MKHALILFAHGARDPRWAAPFERLCEIARSQLHDTEVVLAFLELMSPRLPEAVAALVQEGYTSVSVVPVFLGQGGHVLRDLPLLVDALRDSFPQVEISVAAAVGEDAAVLQAIAHYCIATVTDRTT